MSERYPRSRLVGGCIGGRMLVLFSLCIMFHSCAELVQRQVYVFWKNKISLFDLFDPGSMG